MYIYVYEEKSGVGGAGDVPQQGVCSDINTSCYLILHENEHVKLDFLGKMLYNIVYYKYNAIVI